MPETVTIEVTHYSLAELKELDGRGYDEALTWLLEGSMEFDWYEFTLDRIAEEFIERWGVTLNVKSVSFDLDRASRFAFKAEGLNTRTFLKAAGLDLRTKAARDLLEYDRLWIDVGYGNRNWVGDPAYERVPEYVEDLTPGVTDKLTGALRDMEEYALKALRDEVEYLESEEHLLELAEMNDYRFTQDGRVWRG